MDSADQVHGVSPIFDSFDIDILAKVLSRTVFSTLCVPHVLAGHLLSLVPHIGPFFVFFIPVFAFFHGSKLNSQVIVWSSLYYVVISFFCEFLKAFILTSIHKQVLACRVSQMVLKAIP